MALLSNAVGAADAPAVSPAIVNDVLHDIVKQFVFMDSHSIHQI